MSTSPKLKQLARHLLGREAALGELADAHENATLRVCEKLRGSLSKLMGIGGFRSLFSRALVLACAEVPGLRAVQIKADGSLERLDKFGAERGGTATLEGEIVLIAQLLGLLATFIGADLTMRLLHDIWPELDDRNFLTGETL